MLTVIYLWLGCLIKAIFIFDILVIFAQLYVMKWHYDCRDELYKGDVLS